MHFVKVGEVPTNNTDITGMQVERIIHYPITIKINLESFCNTVQVSVFPMIIHIRLQVTVKVNVDPSFTASPDMYLFVRRIEVKAIQANWIGNKFVSFVVRSAIRSPYLRHIITGFFISGRNDSLPSLYLVSRSVPGGIEVNLIPCHQDTCPLNRLQTLPGSGSFHNRAGGEAPHLEGLGLVICQTEGEIAVPILGDTPTGSTCSNPHVIIAQLSFPGIDIEAPSQETHDVTFTFDAYHLFGNSILVIIIEKKRILPKRSPDFLFGIKIHGYQALVSSEMGMILAGNLVIVIVNIISEQVIIAIINKPPDTQTISSVHEIHPHMIQIPITIGILISYNSIYQSIRMPVGDP
ncbi:hypothetical protein DSECCO2_526180 [anaerobic digester metagenome]